MSLFFASKICQHLWRFHFFHKVNFFILRLLYCCSWLFLSKCIFCISISFSLFFYIHSNDIFTSFVEMKNKFNLIFDNNTNNMIRFCKYFDQLNDIVNKFMNYRIIFLWFQQHKVILLYIYQNYYKIFKQSLLLDRKFILLYSVFNCKSKFVVKFKKIPLF